MRILSFCIAGFLLVSCSKKKDIYRSPTFSENNILQGVVEIPAGTNKKIEYNTHSLQFEIDKKNGVDRIIDFLPYPGNYGFIPSTYSDPDKGGDGDALDVLIIAENIPTGTIVEILPIGVLKLIDNKELDYKIIAIPLRKELQVMAPRTFDDFNKRYPKAKEIISMWFSNYDQKDSLYVEGWGNEKEALAEINKSLHKKNNLWVTLP
jgi:inorganic pyrophosphatase